MRFKIDDEDDCIGAKVAVVMECDGRGTGCWRQPRAVGEWKVCST
jgi:hypothetical protein